MFEKNLTKPYILEQHEALQRRLKGKHVKMPEIEESISLLKAGYWGEQTLNYHLSLLPSKSFHIFHDIRLPTENSYFQIDAFLLSEKFGLIIDSKNYSGTLTLDKFQLTQVINDLKKVYQNPISQTNRHIILLNNLFSANQIPNLPIENLVCFSYSTSILKITPGYTEAYKRVCKADNLLKKIGEVGKYHKSDILDPNTIEAIKRLILTKNTPLKYDILNKYNIGQNEIVTGVQCPHCFHIPMKYRGKKWECPICLYVFVDAHHQAIKDYFLLIKPWIKNSELREFLHLPSPRAAAYLLSLLYLPFSGDNKGRIYLQPHPFP